MTDQEKHTNTLRSLHVPGEPLLLCNIWDAGTAKIVAASGAEAIATGSWAIAAAHGKSDGEEISFEAVLGNIACILEAVDLPVTVDLESGYGPTPEALAETVASAVKLGVAGFNLEDQVIGGDRLYSVEEQASRIAAARLAADASGSRPFLNARTDVFIQAGPEPAIEKCLNDVIERAKTYQRSGADGLFVPGLLDTEAIRTLCVASPLPVNIMVQANSPSCADLSSLGVARISFGPGPYAAAMNALTEQAQQLYGRA